MGNNKKRHEQNLLAKDFVESNFSFAIVWLNKSNWRMLFALTTSN